MHLWYLLPGPPAHSGVLHPSCSPWTSRLWLWTSSFSPGLQGFRHEAAVDGDRKRKVSWDFLPLQQHLQTTACVWHVCGRADWSTWRRANTCRTSWRSWRQRSNLWSWRSSNSSTRPTCTAFTMRPEDTCRTPSTYLTATYVFLAFCWIYFYAFWKSYW